ncbi:MAG TPA: hypothetical protein GXZ96_05095 [Firmicutes bacterium]|jgi:hypothetical protein|nr:hypothetical protein [Bacillota bacterium]
MAGILIGIFILAALSVLSVHRRAANLSVRQESDLPVVPQPSPISRAVRDLVATAGGIYVSLVLLVSFLQIELPARLHLPFGFQVEPLAGIALLVAIIYPFFDRQDYR